MVKFRVMAAFNAACALICFGCAALMAAYLIWHLGVAGRERAYGTMCVVDTLIGCGALTVSLICWRLAREERR